MSTATLITLQGVSPGEVSVFDMTKATAKPFVSIDIAGFRLFIDDPAVLDALHEAVTRAYELLAAAGQAA